MALQSEILPWQSGLWKHLCQYTAQQRVPQALLISGPKGLGKQRLADQFAYSLLCTGERIGQPCCGHCDSCVLLAAGTHPDYILVQPEEPGKAITVGQIRNLIARLMLKPQFEAYRVVIINPAEQLNNAAANAFLKCLEEPSERTVIILITDKPASLPATVVSRCQKLALAKPDTSTQWQWLKQQNIHGNLEVLCGLAQGAPLLAQKFADEDMLALRNRCFKAWLAIAGRQSHPVLIAEEWHKLPGAPLLFWVTSWLVDLIRCYYQAPSGKLYNPDLCQPLQELSQRLDLKRVYKLYDLLLTNKKRLETPINKQSMFEEILIDWFELNQRN